MMSSPGTRFSNCEGCLLFVRLDPAPADDGPHHFAKLRELDWGLLKHSVCKKYSPIHCKLPLVSSKIKHRVNRAMGPISYSDNFHTSPQYFLRVRGHFFLGIPNIYLRVSSYNATGPTTFNNHLLSLVSNFSCLRYTVPR